MKGSLFFIVTAIFCYAPFIHIHFPKDQVLEIFGWKNPYKFLYAVGKPICMLYFAFYILIRMYRKENNTNDLIASCMLMGISFFFLFWCTIDAKELPKWMYYAALASVSLITTVMSFFVVKHLKSIETEAIGISKKLFSVIIETIKKLPKDSSDELVRDLHKTIEQ